MQGFGRLCIRRRDQLVISAILQYFSTIPSCMLSSAGCIPAAVKWQLTCRTGGLCRKRVHGHGHRRGYDRAEAHRGGHEHGLPAAGIQPDLQQRRHAALHLRGAVQGALPLTELFPEGPPLADPFPRPISFSVIDHMGGSMHTHRSRCMPECTGHLSS